MRYKTLLMGENNAVIDDFFLRMYGHYEIMTTSTRNEDIVKHLEVFKPDIFIYCINANSYKDYNSMYLLSAYLRENDTPLAVIGSEEECREFNKATLHMADLILIKPITADNIMEKIDSFVAKRRKKYTKNLVKYNEPAEYEEPVKYEESAKYKEPAKYEESEEPAELTVETLLLLAEQVIKEERKHILVIDDDPMMLKLVNEQLREFYDVATAISGKIAFKFLETKRTDLILLDYEMPGDNGAAVLTKLRQNPATKDIPVVFLTGVSERERIQEVLQMKPQGYLLKPIDFQKLLSLIKGILYKY